MEHLNYFQNDFFEITEENLITEVVLIASFIP